MHPFTKWMQKRGRDSPSSGAENTHHNGDFSTYFRNKQIKLDNQAKDSIEQQSSIFAGCVIYITGYTVPSSTQLKQLVVANGGQICAMLGGKTYATHIVATSLTARKREQYANYTVVTPQWVVDCVRSQKRLDWTNYSLFNSTTDRVEVSVEQDEETEVANGQQRQDAVPLPTDTENNNKDMSLRSAQIQWILDQRPRVDCTQPNFAKDYFRNSRLHFLSTFKLELRKRCRAYMRDAGLAQTGAPPGQAPLNRILMHVDFDSFFVAVALKKRPHLLDKPVCVSHGGTGSDVASCNYVARKFGVKNGMWVSMAKEVCPEIICLPYDFEDYKFCSQRLYDVLLGLKPQQIVAISVDEAILDVSKNEYFDQIKLLPNETQKNVTVDDLCTFVRSQIKTSTGIDASVGVGSNVLLCKLALKLAKPAGQHEIKDLSEVLDMKVTDLPGVGYQTAHKLSEMECFTIRDLKKVPLITLQNELGTAMGHKLYGYALGADTVNLEQLDVPLQSVGLDIGWGVRVISKTEQDIFVLNCVSELYDRIEQADLRNTKNAGSGHYTVKIHKRSPEAHFITTKYMGHGQCEVTSRGQVIPLKLTLEQLQQTTREMVREIVELSHCEPLDFRGLGLHLKVKPGSTRVNNNTLHNYFSLSSAAAPSEPTNNLLKTGLAETSSESRNKSPSISSKKQMYAVPPRKKSKHHTLTQMVLPKDPFPVNEDIDLDVLAELPEHIQQEVLREVHRSGGSARRKQVKSTPKYQPKVEPPIYTHPSFMGLYGAELRQVLRDWVSSTDSPSLEDIQQFYTYACDAVRCSRWCDTLDLIDWLHFCCYKGGKWLSEDWRVFYETLDARIQQLAVLTVER